MTAHLISRCFFLDLDLSNSAAGKIPGVCTLEGKAYKLTGLVSEGARFLLRLHQLVLRNQQTCIILARFEAGVFDGLSTQQLHLFCFWFMSLIVRSSGIEGITQV